jgi:hypothetical protein
VRRAELGFDQRPSGRQHFAVRLPGKAGEPVERLTIDRLGGVTLRGQTRLVTSPNLVPREDASDLFLAAVEEAEFVAGDIRDPAALTCKFNTQLKSLQTKMGRRISTQLALSPLTGTNRQELAVQLNALLQQPALASLVDRPLPHQMHGSHSATGVELQKNELSALGPKQVVRINRRRLDSLYPDELVAWRPPQASALALLPLPTPPEEARPWTIYRANLRPTEDAAAPPEPGGNARQVRIEIGTTGDVEHPERSQFAVGYYYVANDEFHSCLSIDEACTLRIAGDLKALGSLVRRPAPVEPGSEDFVDQLIEEWLKNFQPVPSTLAVDLSDLNQVQAGTPWPYTIRVANTGVDPVRLVTVMENFSVDQGTVSATTFVDGVAELAGGGTQDVEVTHPVDLPAGNQVAVQVTAIGYNLNSRAMYSSAGKIANILP